MMGMSNLQDAAGSCSEEMVLKSLQRDRELYLKTVRPLWLFRSRLVRSYTGFQLPDDPNINKHLKEEQMLKYGCA